ncbi:hypothetical protein LTR53_005932 [Teratosphaeriaceae sp. CCFEE 6253]|nr:hypothetical protein LTR53_005932 [Teratosphaeriaceae sp. CCFEE 6253]
MNNPLYTQDVDPAAWGADVGNVNEPSFLDLDDDFPDPHIGDEHDLDLSGYRPGRSHEDPEVVVPASGPTPHPEGGTPAPFASHVASGLWYGGANHNGPPSLPLHDPLGTSGSLAFPVAGYEGGTPSAMHGAQLKHSRSFPAYHNGHGWDTLSQSFPVSYNGFHQQNHGHDSGGLAHANTWSPQHAPSLLSSALTTVMSPPPNAQDMGLDGLLTRHSSSPTVAGPDRPYTNIDPRLYVRPQLHPDVTAALPYAQEQPQSEWPFLDGDVPALDMPSEAASIRPRSRTLSKAPEAAWSWTGENPVCTKCPGEKRFKPTPYNEGQYCNKHYKMAQKSIEAQIAPVYPLLDGPDAESHENTQGMVYPTLPPLVYQGEGVDDWQEMQHHETHWVAQFLVAANTQYTEDTREALPLGLDDADSADADRRHENALKQQSAYNHKPHHESSKEYYTPAWVNARMRMLFRSVLIYHQGGAVLYAQGGNNNGYGEDKTLRMSERLARITKTMARDKRVVMDVIEGRGVAALAANPSRFADRKNSNNKCNEKKKRKLAAAGMAVPDFDEWVGGKRKRSSTRSSLQREYNGG